MPSTTSKSPTADATANKAPNSATNDNNGPNATAAHGDHTHTFKALTPLSDTDYANMTNSKCTASDCTTRIWDPTIGLKHRPQATT